MEKDNKASRIGHKNRSRKKDIIAVATSEAIEDGIVYLLRYVFNDKKIPPREEIKVYQTLTEYFQHSKYTLKDTSQGSEIIITHNNYDSLKIFENKNNFGFKKFSVDKNEDSLEARIILDVPLLTKEFVILAEKNKNGNAYTCIEVSYNNRIIYNRNDSTYNKNNITAGK
jgi:hypothetical protein